eukprot:11169337-Lingulodinium_polyedra.AAC.1
MARPINGHPFARRRWINGDDPIWASVFCAGAFDVESFLAVMQPCQSLVGRQAGYVLSRQDNPRRCVGFAKEVPVSVRLTS